ncbi:MAG TPA: hypothetical protein DEP05_10245 [Betaproteobacteria bacterium]|nr:hypothetical protein [Betaproteobacteria bacterium]
MTRDTPAFAGKTILVSGGSRGIGYATAAAFLDAGANVAICGIDAAHLREAGETLADRGAVAVTQADVSRYADVQRWVEETAAHFGGVDVVVANAGRLVRGNVAALAVAEMDKVLDTNIKGVVYLCRAALPYLLRQRSGVIVNVSSGLGKQGLGGVAVYCASKSAVLGFTESLAQEVADDGVRVYAICPGMVATDMQIQYSGRKTGLPPERLAENILRLASAAAPIPVGECLAIGP